MPTLVLKSHMGRRMDLLGLRNYTLARAIGSTGHSVQQWREGIINPPLDKAILIAGHLLGTVEEIWVPVILNEKEEENESGVLPLL